MNFIRAFSYACLASIILKGAPLYAELPPQQPSIGTSPNALMNENVTPRLNVNNTYQPQYNASNGSSDNSRSDGEITTKLQDLMTADQTLLGSNIRFNCIGAIVIFEGSATSQRQVTEALALARKVPGVREVHSNVTVSNNNITSTIMPPPK